MVDLLVEIGGISLGWTFLSWEEVKLVTMFVLSVLVGVDLLPDLVINFGYTFARCGRLCNDSPMFFLLGLRLKGERSSNTVGVALGGFFRTWREVVLVTVHVLSVLVGVDLSPDLAINFEDIFSRSVRFCDDFPRIFSLGLRFIGG